MKGILFKEDMFRATIEGRKTETRRTGGLDRVNENPALFSFFHWGDIRNKKVAIFEGDGWAYLQRPRFQLGDIAYIKEPHFLTSGRIAYEAQQIDKPTNRLFSEDLY